jgi:hypothetical protein
MPMNDASAGPVEPVLPLLVAADLQDHLLMASRDLARLQDLLTHACQTLMQRFHQTAAGVAGLRAMPPGTAGTADTLDAMTQELHAAVVALQFEDMATQLIGHTHRRLRNCADQIARHAFNDDEPALVEPAPIRPNPVTQSEMDAGSVELF